MKIRLARQPPQRAAFVIRITATHPRGTDLVLTGETFLSCSVADDFANAEVQSVSLIEEGGP